MQNARVAQLERACMYVLRHTPCGRHVPAPFDGASRTRHHKERRDAFVGEDGIHNLGRRLSCKVAVTEKGGCSSPVGMTMFLEVGGGRPLKHQHSPHGRDVTSAGAIDLTATPCAADSIHVLRGCVQRMSTWTPLSENPAPADHPVIFSCIFGRSPSPSLSSPAPEDQPVAKETATQSCKTSVTLRKPGPVLPTCRTE